jgi:hypothetical protein
MYYAKQENINWVEVQNLQGDIFLLLPELLEDHGDGDYELGPSGVTESMDKAWELYEEALLIKLETNDPMMPLPNQYMQHIYNLHCLMKGDFKTMDYEALRRRECEPD